ncbi:flippase activity-associated protein Agl23 [Halobaculum sp. MBLA0147]|uniref:flippase activity-associated protein Agl23 n=1 Tax=Halobaculum sp. MBLA0147 TaxID=3079934 RepID=UPI00352698D5
MSERPDRVVAVVAAVTVVALLARLVALDARPFHWSEGRVGFWALRFAETGVFDYRPVAGGPLVYVLARWAIELGGVSDGAVRVPVAVIGGLAPLAALLFRGALDDGETVALAALLGVEPLFVYYSRFLRGDVPAAVFGLVVVGGLVRYATHDDRRGLYLAAGSLAAAVGASGFGFAYPLVWLLGGLFALDEARVRRRPAEAVATVRHLADAVAERATPLARGAFVFLGVWFVLFAPRTAGLAPGLYDPLQWVGAAGPAFQGAVEEFVGYRIVYRLNPRTPGRHGLVEYAVGIVRTLVTATPVLLAAGFVGFFSERYRDDTRRLVAFGGYATLWGLLVFAVAASEPYPWVAVHLVPFVAIPAAVGLTRGVRALRVRVSARDYGRVTLAVALVVAAVAAGGVPVADAYDAPERGSPLAQYGQPTDDPATMLPAVERAIRGNEGVDVLYVAPRFHTRNEYDQPPIAAIDQSSWGNRLPLPWYFERVDAETDTAFNASYVPTERPPVVVTTPRYEDRVAEYLGGGYSRSRLQTALFRQEVTVFVRQES